MQEIFTMRRLSSYILLVFFLILVNGIVAFALVAQVEAGF